MAKFLADAVLDAALDELETADQLVICEGEPATYAAATTDQGAGGDALGEIAIDSSDFTKADGDTSGRKTTVAQQTGVAIDVTSAGADHIALVDDGASRLLAVTTCTSQAVTSGNTATVNAFDLELLDVS